MRCLLLVMLLGACAIDDPELATDESAIEPMTYWHQFEVEDGSILGATRITNQVTASNGLYLAFTAGGSSRFFFDVYLSEYYNAWARVISPASKLTIDVDGRTASTFLDVNPSWVWVSLGTLRMDRGARTLRISADTDGVLVDRVLLVQGQPWTPMATTYEAEAGSLVYPMTIGTQRLPTTKFVTVPNGSVAGGRVDLDVTTNKTDTYFVWGRTNAPSTADNAFGLGKDGSSYGTWNVPVTSSSGWTWNLAGTMTLDRTDVVSITRQDDGTKLDKILITNDPGFHLVEASPPMVVAP